MYCRVVNKMRLFTSKRPRSYNFQAGLERMFASLIDGANDECDLVVHLCYMNAINYYTSCYRCLLS